MCNPDTVATDDVPNRIDAHNSSTVEEATQEITQACKDIKPGEQEVRLFACLCRGENGQLTSKCDHL